jgi:branched-chain amino acid aminotransferase
LQPSEPTLFYCDRFLPEAELSLARSNRALRYGDAVFETMRLSRGKPLFHLHHYSRFIRGMETLQMDIPEHWQPDFMLRTLQELSVRNAAPNARARMTAWRSGGGFYLPVSSAPELLIELEALPEPYYAFPREGLVVDISERVQLSPSALMSVKSANALPYVLAAMEARERQLDDVLLCHPEGHLVEASSSNLFLFREGTLFSPPEEDGGVPGIMRSVLIKVARRAGVSVRLERLYPEDLERAEEVFLTNVIRGIRWVGRWRERTYGNQFSAGLFGKLEEKVLAELGR